MDLFKTLTSLLIAFMGGVFAKPRLFNSGMKKIRTTIESQDLFDKYKTSFKEDFILQDLKESYFYVQTGINTNERSIEKYIYFKNKIGRDCTWNTIKAIKTHLRFNGDGIYIKLEKWQIIIGFIGLFFGMSLCFIGIGLFYYFSNHIAHGALNDVIFLVFVMGVFEFVGMFFICQVSSILIARAIQKMLNRIE